MGSLLFYSRRITLFVGPPGTSGGAARGQSDPTVSLFSGRLGRGGGAHLPQKGHALHAPPGGNGGGAASGDNQRMTPSNDKRIGKACSKTLEIVLKTKQIHGCGGCARHATER